MEPPEYFNYDCLEAALASPDSKYAQWAFVDSKNVCAMVKSHIEGRLAIWMNTQFHMVWANEAPDPKNMRPYEWHCIPQASIGPFKADFLILNKRKSGSVVKVVLECDGHEFHEKTKEQVAKDKKRDRFMTKEGYKVLRFSGYEIYKTPDQCCNDIAECIFNGK